MPATRLTRFADGASAAVALTPCRGVRPTAGLAARVSAVAAELRREAALGLAEDARHRRPAIRGRAIHLEDPGAIPLADRLEGIAGLQLRARMRAAAGDVVLASVAVPRAYEEYGAARLGLGAAEWLRTSGAEVSLELGAAAAQDRGCFAALVALARRGPCFLHPYLASPAVWRLARRLSESAGRAVPVLGPPPRLCALANNKIHFCRLVAGLLGPDAVLEQRTGARAVDLVQHVRELAPTSARLCLQRPSSASGLGNRILEGREAMALDGEALEGRLRQLLGEMAWDGSEEVRVVRWEERALASPSVQLWIPAAGRGLVRCEGIFLQRFAPAYQGRFAGAVPAALPLQVTRRLRRESCAIGTVLQRLGYLGRCSLDALLLPAASGELRSAQGSGGASGPALRLRYVECNARWGGVSTPMTLLNRLDGDHRRLRYAIGELAVPGLEAVGFAELLRLLASELYEPGRRRGVIVVNPASDGKLSIVGVSASQEEAEELIGDRLPRLLCGAEAAEMAWRPLPALAAGNEVEEGAVC